MQALHQDPSNAALGRKVVVVSPFYPSFRASGSATRLAQVLMTLKDAGVQTHFVRIALWPIQRRENLDRYVDRCTVLNLRGESFREESTLEFRKCNTPQSLPMQWYHRLRCMLRRPLEQLRQIVASEQPDILYIDHTRLAHLIQELPRVSKRLDVVDTHDVLHARDAALGQAGLEIESAITREQEAKLLSPFDVIIAIQDNERELLQAMVPGASVVTVAHACPVAPKPCTGQSIRFVGSNYHVNIANLMAFIREAWPAVRESFPETTLEVAGGVSDAADIREAASRDGRIVPLGVVPEIEDLYDGPAVMICPLWAGSGLKIKVVEALAHGKATVATPIAAQGLEDGRDWAFLVADQPRDFVPLVSRLLKSTQARVELERAALRYAENKFGPNEIARRLLRALSLTDKTSQKAA